MLISNFGDSSNVNRFLYLLFFFFEIPIISRDIVWILTPPEYLEKHTHFQKSVKGHLNDVAFEIDKRDDPFLSVRKTERKMHWLCKIQMKHCFYECPTSKLEKEVYFSRFIVLVLQKIHSSASHKCHVHWIVNQNKNHSMGT